MDCERQLISTHLSTHEDKSNIGSMFECWYPYSVVDLGLEKFFKTRSFKLEKYFGRGGICN
jgi:hypothetical protein